MKLETAIKDFTKTNTKKKEKPFRTVLVYWLVSQRPRSRSCNTASDRSLESFKQFDILLQETDGLRYSNSFAMIAGIVAIFSNVGIFAKHS